MPYITVEGGQMTVVQKEQLIAKLTEISSEIMNVPQEFFMNVHAILKYLKSLSFKSYENTNY